MLQVLPCPECGKQSLIPNQTSLEATIKCPHCGAQLVLGEVFLTQFSSWSVIEDPADLYNANPRKLDPGVVIPVPADDAPLELVADTSPQPVYIPKPSPSGRSGNLSEYERRKRKQKSPIWSIIPVVLGGLAAFPIALLIIWYVLGKDIGNLGPQVAEYAPWIVPKKFHPSAPASQPGRPRAPQRGASGFRQFDDVMPQPKVAPELDNLPSENSVAPMNSKDGSSKDTSKDSESKDSESKDSESKDSESKDSESKDGSVDSGSRSDDKMPQSNSTPSLMPNPMPTAIASAPSIDKEATKEPVEAGPNIFAIIRETQSAIELLSNERKTELLYAAYGKLAELEGALQNFDKQNPVWRTINSQMNSLAKQIAQKELLGPIGNVSAKEIKDQKDSKSIVAAIVIEVTAAEQLTSDWTAFGKHILPAETIIEIPRQVSAQVIAEKKYFALGSYHRSESTESAPVFRVSYLYPL